MHCQWQYTYYAPVKAVGPWRWRGETTTYISLYPNTHYMAASALEAWERFERASKKTRDELKAEGWRVKKLHVELDSKQWRGETRKAWMAIGRIDYMLEEIARRLVAARRQVCPSPGPVSAAAPAAAQPPSPQEPT